MKMIAGLTNPTEGQIELFGSENGLNENRERTSFMIEAPYLDTGNRVRAAIRNHKLQGYGE